jgi:hypothetical protein
MENDGYQLFELLRNGEPTAEGFWPPPCESKTFDPAAAAGPAHAGATT